MFDLSENEIEEVVNFKTKRFFKSLIDKTVLWKAKQLNCLLLTGDAKLRSEAEENEIKVHGSLWVIRMIIEQNIMSAKSAVEYLGKLKIINDRLPQEEIEKLIKKLKS